MRDIKKLGFLTTSMPGAAILPIIFGYDADGKVIQAPLLDDEIPLRGLMIIQHNDVYLVHGLGQKIIVAEFVSIDENPEQIADIWLIDVHRLEAQPLDMIGSGQFATTDEQTIPLDLQADSIALLDRIFNPSDDVNEILRMTATLSLNGERYIVPSAHRVDTMKADARSHDLWTLQAIMARFSPADDADYIDGSVIDITRAQSESVPAE